jgi:hypothetical protein
MHPHPGENYLIEIFACIKFAQKSRRSVISFFSQPHRFIRRVD